MIFFLRKIRNTVIKNAKFKNYNLYAIGEMILVVVGILKIKMTHLKASEGL